MHEKKNPNRPLIVYYIIALVVVMLLNALLFPQIERYSVKQVDYSEFLSMLEDGKVKSVEIDDTQIAFTPVEQIQDGKATYYTTNRVTADDKLVERLLAAGVEFGQVVPEEMSPIISFLVTWVLPLVIFYGLGSFMFRKMSQRMGGNTMSFGKSNAKIYVEAQTGKTFDDVAGEDEAKDALKEIVDFLHDPQKYRDIGAKLPSAARRPSRHGQNAAGEGRRGRGEGAVLLDFRLGICGDVCRHGRGARARPVQAGGRESAVHRLHR